MKPLENSLEHLKSFFDDLKKNEIGTLDAEFIEEHKSEIYLTAFVRGFQTIFDTIIGQTVHYCRMKTDEVIEKEHEKMVNNPEYFELIQQEVACRTNPMHEEPTINPDWIKKSELG